MAKAYLRNKTGGLEEQAMIISGEIFSLMNQYTHDSNISKFFLKDGVAMACYGLAGGFASTVYDPPLKPEEVKDRAILSYTYALMTYGFNIYLKERSLRTNAKPYIIPTDESVIKKIQKKTLSDTKNGKLLSTPLADKIIKIIVANINKRMKLKDLSVRAHKLDKKKFMQYSKLSMYWSYNFARELLAE